MSLQQDEFQAQLEALKQGYARQLPAKVGKIQAAVEAFFAAPWNEESCGATYRLVHSLAGSSGTYGFAELCKSAQSAEAFLRSSMDSRSPLGEPQKADLRGLLSLLAAQAHTPS